MRETIRRRALEPAATSRDRGETMGVRFLAAGDRGLVVEFGDAIDVAINNQVRALA